MKAIVRETYGSPDVLHLEDVPLPTLRDGDVLVRVRAASANAGDWHLLRGTPLPFRLIAGLRTPTFRIIGTDVAGHIEAVGRNVTQFRPGATKSSENSPEAGSVRMRNSRLRPNRRWR